MNRTSSRILAVAASLTLAAALAGCGSDDKDTSTTLTATQFKEQANKLCADANKETDTYGADINQNSSDADVAAAIKKTVDRNEQLVSDIEHLKAPSDLEGDVTSMLADVRAGLTQMGKLGSVADLQAFDPTTGVFKSANDKATALGLPDCAK